MDITQPLSMCFVILLRVKNDNLGIKVITRLFMFSVFFFIYKLLLDKPENFQFGPSKIEVSQDEAINFTCSADGNPAVHTYQLFENEILVTESSTNHGIWNRTMSTGGVFIYKCVAKNAAGTGQSESVTVIVNGEQYKLHVVLTT